MNKKELNNYLKRTDIIIENNVATWDLSMEGQIHGLYSGQFKFKCFLTPTEKLAVGRMFRELIGQGSITVLKHEESLAFALAHLRFRIIAAPPFWSSSIGIDGLVGDIPDENVLNHIFNACIDAEFKYFAQIQKKKEQALIKAKAAAEKMLNAKENAEDEEDDEE